MRFRRSVLVLSSAAVLLLGACAPAPYVCTRSYGDMCERALVDGDLQQAETYCDLGLEFAPENANLWALKGRIALLRGDTEQAKKHLLQALQYNPNHPRALVNLGLTHLQEEAYGPAHQRFSQARKVAPADLEARYGLGAALMRLNRREEARKELVAARDGEPGNPLYHHVLAILEYEARNLESASQLLSKVTQLDPTSSRAWHDLGIVLMDQRRFSDAEAAFRECVRFEELNAECLAGLERARRTASP